ncbi:MAG: TonB-dependent receptor [Bacteroidales bacterium]|nr:TonB-dependent receptor [Bacteroidales bacterium]
MNLRKPFQSFPKKLTAGAVRALFVAVLLTCSGFSASGGQYGDTSSGRTGITIVMPKTQMTLSEAMNLIESQTGLRFVYSDAKVDTRQRISLPKGQTSLETLLTRIAGSNLNYSIENGLVILSPREAEEKQDKAITVKGVVVDENGAPIAGITVQVVENPTKGAVTDLDGNFVISRVAPGSTLRVSGIGFREQKISVDGATFPLRIVLSENTELLEEVVVVGYGVQKKSDVTGAVANISSEKLNTHSNVNIGQALQGRIAGVDIVSQGGAPGSGTRVMVRGIGTLNNATPLYIVDGMYMGSIDHINPNDIKSIDVLKDASSSAIYGSRAANGVVIITTKSGSDTQGKPIFDLSVNYGIQTPSKYLNMLDSEGWAKVVNASLAAVGKPQHDMTKDLSINNDWQRMMMGAAPTQNYNLSVNGGTKYFTYYTGLGYTDQQGIIKGTDYKRFNLQFKSEYKKDFFSIGNNIILTKDDNIPLYPYARGGYLGIILQSIPTLKTTDPDNKVSGYGKVFGESVDVPNPLGILDADITKRTNENYRVLANIYATINLPWHLKYKLNFTPQYGFYRNYTYENVFDFGRRNNAVSNANESRVQTSSYLIENLLTFDQTFGKHKVTALLGYSYQTDLTRFLSASGKALPENIYEVGATTKERGMNGNSVQSALTSLLSRIFYSYDNRYLITLTYRRDGSSKFAPANRYGNFPSFSLGWNVAEESFMAPTRGWLDQFKLRGGFGVLGNQEIADYSYTSTVTTNINYPDGKGGLYSGAFPKTFSNPNIIWENTEMTNVGADLAFLGSRLTVTLDWYNKNTRDILLAVPIPPSTGGANDPVRNAGRIRNTGFEWVIGWQDFINDALSYDVSFVGSAMRNEVVEMGDANQVINGGANRTGVTTTKTLVGYPIGGFWLIPTGGLFRSEAEVKAHSLSDKLIQPNAKPGDVRFVDTNGDGTINDSDRVYMGSPFPTFTFGLSGNITWKSLDFGISTQGVFGNKIYNATRLELEGTNKGANYLSSTLNYWTKDNPDATFPRPVWDDPNNNFRPESDRFLESGDYFRLRSIQLGYTLHNLFGGKIQKARAYVNVENALTFTKYSGYTPDINSGGATSRGFDNFVYPLNRVYMLGLNFSF